MKISVCWRSLSTLLFQCFIKTASLSGIKWPLILLSLPTNSPVNPSWHRYKISKGSNLLFVDSGLLSGKELSFCHKLWFSNSYNFATRFPKPLIFQTFNSVSLKYQRFTSSGSKDIWVKKCEFVAKTQILSLLRDKHDIITSLCSTILFTFRPRVQLYKLGW